MHKGFGHTCGECYYSRIYAGDVVCKINGKVYDKKKACGLFRQKPAYMMTTEELYSLEDIQTSAKKVSVGNIYFFANSPSAVLSRARHSASFPGYASRLVEVREDSSTPFGFENVRGEIVWFKYVIGRKDEPMGFIKAR